MTDFYVYVHRKATNGEIFYVGKGCNDRANCNGRSAHWKSIVAKHGRTVHILEHYTTENDAFAMERYLIESYRSIGNKLCNMTDGGEGNAGFKWPEELKKKLSVSHSGRKCSNEHKAKMSALMKQRASDPDERKARSEAAKNRWQNPEYRAKMRQGQLNRQPPSAETLAKMRASQTARWNTNRKD